MDIYRKLFIAAGFEKKFGVSSLKMATMLKYIGAKY
jgi:hypothetical protein